MVTTKLDRSLRLSNSQFLYVTSLCRQFNLIKHFLIIAEPLPNINRPHKLANQTPINNFENHPNDFL